MSMYDEYVDARNEALVLELDKYSKAMYQHICNR